LDAGTISEAIRCLDAAEPLDRVVRRAAELTAEHFGTSGVSCAGSPKRWKVLLYAPVYVSNYCINHCRYCGFRHPEAIQRRHLDVEEALSEAEVLQQRGFRHVLVVAGDYPQLTRTPYFVEILRRLRTRGLAPAAEIAPQSTESYAALAAAGACGITLYQETYDEGLYRHYHPRGTKASYDWRLEGLERAAEAGIPRLGFGFLLGLADPQSDLLAMLRHARYVAGRFPDKRLAFSLPRIHDAPPGFHVPHPVGDELFVRMYCALRIAFPQAMLVLSTREPRHLRDRLTRICITQLSAGSSTAPGGYHAHAGQPAAGEQFPVCDQRCLPEVLDWLQAEGFEPTWEVEAL
jgi:2-iminoacetate synthase